LKISNKFARLKWECVEMELMTVAHSKQLIWEFLYQKPRLQLLLLSQARFKIFLALSSCSKKEDVLLQHLSSVSST
jgi:hypothetical protein